MPLSELVESKILADLEKLRGKHNVLSENFVRFAHQNQEQGSVSSGSDEGAIGSEATGAATVSEFLSDQSFTPAPKYRLPVLRAEGPNGN